MTVPLFVSARRLAMRKKLPRAAGAWALDSGGFSELSLHGGWQTPSSQYVEEVRRWRDEIGQLEWASAQDWMCEPFMIQRTGLSVRRHQELTVSNFVDLMQRDPSLPWVPVLQGWATGEYLNHLEAYARAGFDLTKRPLVGIGSVCRRQNTFRAEHLVRELHSYGLRLHGFGFKTTGLPRVWDVLTSSDSLAWSYNARRHPPMHECEGKHASCANCPRWAERWLGVVLDKVARAARGGGQLPLRLLD
jgi:hypothetical protein